MRKYWLFLIVLGITLITALPVSANGADNGRIVQIPFASAEQLAELAARLDVWEVHRDAQHPQTGYVVAYISTADAAWLTSTGVAFTESSLNLALPETIPGFPCYRTVEEIYAQLEQWAEAYPGFTQLLTIGQSYENRPLRVMRVTNEATGVSGKPIFFLMANIHGRELITPETALVFMQYLLENYGVDPDVTWLLDEHLIYILTSANPDGHIKNEAGQPWAYWRKNTHPYGTCSPDAYGVDLNRNSSFHWGGPGASTDPCDDTYRGPSAASESETIRLQSFVASLFPDQRGPADTDPAPDDTTGVFITLHSYSNLVLWPWGDTSTPAPNSVQLQMLGRRMASFNGYTPQQSSGLYPTSGATDDWAYGELGVAAYTFEIGSDSDGFYPACSRYDALIQPNVAALLYAAKVARTPYITSFGPHAQNVAVTPSAVLIGQPIAVQAALNDADSKNSGQTIVAAEAYLGTPPWDGGTPIPLTAVDGAFDETAEAVQGQLATAGLARGRHLVYVRGQDANGFWGPLSAAFVELLDSSTLTGRVVASGAATPLPGARITADNGAALSTTQTDASGQYTLTLHAGTYTVTASLLGYASGSAVLSTTIGQTSTQDFALTRLPWGTLALAVAELGTARPLTATITLEGLRLTWTAAPTLSLELPVGVYTFTATAAAHQARSYTVAIAEGARATHIFRLPPTPALLVVDDDAGASYEPYLLPVLDALAIPYARWTIATQGPVMTPTLAAYTAALWFTGDDAVNSLTRAEQITVQSYLDNGGRLFVTGQNIGMDIKNDNGAFFRTVLHAAFVQDNAGVTETTGLSFYTGITATLSGGDGANNQTSPDVIAPYDAAATPVFTYTTGAAGLAVDDGARRLIYLAFGLEGVADSAQRAVILRDGLAWLGLPLPASRLDLAVTAQPPRVSPGIPVTYSLALLNDSLLPMTDGVLTLTLPSPVTVLAYAPAATEVTPGMLVWRDLALASEAVQNFAWTVVVPTDAALETFASRITASWPGLTAPAELEVTATVAAPYALELSPPVSYQSGSPGAMVSHHLTVTNAGTLTATVSLTTSPSVWVTQIVPMQLTLPVGGSAPVTVTVTIPVTGTALLAAPHTLTVTATILEAPAVQAQAVLTTALEPAAHYVYLPVVLRGQ
ncbi:MAG TPA: M14 family zinc carboxypeptidase [Anaerolineae bacterium]|nr:M14 family zinc carboxypeptidase [Anaerolineae bacterium]HQI85196.1 M14 family zinc carboxypeptidase [Anaerolineae bacterium]